MLIHEQFGIPTPLVESNPYRLTAQRALSGKVSLPEGQFAPLLVQFFRPWFADLKDFLESRIDTALPVVVETRSVPRIRFRISSYYQQQAAKLPLDDFDRAHLPPTLHDLIPYAMSGGVKQRQEFVEFMRHYMDAQVFERVCQRHKIKYKR